MSELNLRANPESEQGGPTLRSLSGELGGWIRSGDIRPLAAWVLALAFLFIYAAKQPGTLSNAQLGLICADTLPLAALGLGQGIVILTAGIDLSVGGVFGLSTTIAATHFTSGGTMVGWGALILAIGLAAGAINGTLIGRFGLQPFIVTLATWSIFDGIALYVLPVEGGQVPIGFSNWINNSAAGLPNAIWALIVMVVIWLWFKRTRTARHIYAIGSDREGARITGVSIDRTLLITYAISGFCAAAAALFYVMLTASGDPTSGDAMILPSVAAVVIGGTALFGGKGGFVGTVAGALTLTLLGAVIFVFNFPSYWTVVADGVLLILAVLMGGGIQAFQASRIRRRT